MSISSVVLTQSGSVYSYNVLTGTVREVFQTSVSLTDIDFGSDGRLYGTSFSHRYTYDEGFGEFVRGVNTAGSANGLEVSDFYGTDSFLFSYSSNRRVDVISDGLRMLATLTDESAGDLELVGSEIYVAIDGRDLQTLDASTGASVRNVDTGVDDIFGLSFVQGRLLGFAGTTVYALDPVFGGADAVVALPTSSRVFGAASGPMIDTARSTEGTDFDDLFLMDRIGRSVDGGVGFDAATYVGQGAVRIDLAASSRNAGAASGDELASVEALFSGNASDVLIGDATGNYLSSAGGNDFLVGRGGNDTLIGGSGGDRLYGGTGGDRLLAGAGDDFGFGGAGNDVLAGGDGRDRLDGEVGNDRIFGQTGDDLLIGNGGADALNGGAGNDRLFGGTGADALGGSAGNDRLFGQAGDDRLFGGAGDDVLAGNLGTDVLFGQGGADRFVYSSAAESAVGAGDLIVRFERGTDLIDLSAIDGGAAPGDQSLAFVGTGAFTGTGGEVRVVAGGVIIDVDGDRGADMVIRTPGAGILAADDFVL